MRRKPGKASPVRDANPANGKACKNQFGFGLGLGWVELNLRPPCRLPASKSGANSRPQKRPYRTVFRAWLLSNKERNKRCFRGRTAAKNSSRPRAEQALKTRLCGRCTASRARQSPVHCANQSGWRRPKADQATRWLWAGFGPGWVLAALVLNGIQPALPLLSRSEIRSKFKAPKTPLSHGLTGLAAIKQGAE